MAVPFASFKEYGNDENCKSFHLILDGEIPSDSSISHKFTKTGRLRQDVLICCREAIKPIKDQLKIDAIGRLCPYRQIALTVASQSVSDLFYLWMKRFILP